MESIIEKIKDIAKNNSSHTGHDFSHTERVFRLAKRIANERYLFVERYVKQFEKEAIGEA